MTGYSKILKQAYEITKNNKFLWILGLFSIALNLVVFLFPEQRSPGLNDIFGLSIILAIILLFRAKAAAIIGVKALLDSQETSLKKSFSTASLFYWRVLGISLLIELASVILLAIVFSPISYMYQQEKITQAITFGIIGFLILLPIIVTAALINILAPLFIVIYDQKIGESIDKSQALVSRHWIPLTGLALGGFLLQIAALFFTMFMVKLAPGMTLFGSALIYLILGSLISAYTQTAWVLIFLQLIKPQKLQSEESVIVPEVIG